MTDADQLAQRIMAEYPMHRAAADRLAASLIADGYVHHDHLPYVRCTCGRSVYLPKLDPNHPEEN